MMARSDLLHARAGYRSARPTTSVLKIQLATRGRSIQKGQFETHASQQTAGIIHSPWSASTGPGFNLVSDECRSLGRHSAIPRCCEVSEPAPQMLPNVGERIQTMSENQKARLYPDYDRAVVRPTVNTVFLRRYDGICSQKRFDAPPVSNSTKPRFFESE